MRIVLVFTFLFTALISLAKENSEDVGKSIEVSGSLSYNTNGVAPIPAFSYGKPVVTANLYIAMNRFSYDPQFSYGLDLKPWIIDNWLHYKLVDKSRFELRTGVNISVFSSDYIDDDVTIRQGQRYMTFELAEIYNISETSTVSLLTWYDKGWEDGTISGYFISLVFDKTNLRLGDQILMDINAHTFYID